MIDKSKRHLNHRGYDPVRDGDPVKDENVYPIKKPSDRNRIRKYWLKNKRTGRRNFMIFDLGIVTGLRASDLLRLRWRQIYDKNGDPHSYIYGEKDKKTNKINHYLDIRPVHDELIVYHQYVIRHISKHPIYMFTQLHNSRKHITPHSLYLIMRKAGEAIGLDHCGSHTIRKTFGYIAYSQTHNLGYVMKKLNQSDPDVTLRYIGEEKASMDQTTESIDFGTH